MNIIVESAFWPLEVLKEKSGFAIIVDYSRDYTVINGV